MKRSNMTANFQTHSFSNGYQTNQYSLDVSIMRTALTLFLVVISVVVILNLLHLYAKCVLRRRARQHRITRLLDIRFTDEQVNSRGEPPKIGLESSVIASLPTFAYGRSDKFDETDAKECTVCLGTLENEEMVKLLPNCKHTYHVECIDMWLNSNSTCPVCRTGAKPLEPIGDDDHVQAPSSELNDIADAVVVDLSNCMTPSSEMVQEIGAQEPVKEGEFELSSFPRVLSRERSGKTNQQSGQSDEDLEKQ